jgi:hypothetical protein
MRANDLPWANRGHVRFSAGSRWVIVIGASRFGRTAAEVRAIRRLFPAG